MSDSPKDNKPTITTRQGHPVYNNQDQRTVGRRGPATLENYPFLEKISHFDRERIPERVVHARGFVAHGHFQNLMVAHFTKCDQDYGRRVAKGIGIDRTALDIEGLLASIAPRRR